MNNNNTDNNNNNNNNDNNNNNNNNNNTDFTHKCSFLNIHINIYFSSNMIFFILGYKNR